MHFFLIFSKNKYLYNYIVRGRNSIIHEIFLMKMKIIIKNMLKNIKLHYISSRKINPFPLNQIKKSKRK